MVDPSHGDVVGLRLNLPTHSTTVPAPRRQCLSHNWHTWLRIAILRHHMNAPPLPTLHGLIRCNISGLEAIWQLLGHASRRAA